MALGAEYERLETLVAAALRAEDPAAAFALASHDAKLTDELRDALCFARPAGIRIAAVLIARLRFERLIQGSREAGSWFDRDPRAFTSAFRRYHQEIAPRGIQPRDEGEAFFRWASGQGLGDALAPGA